MGGVRSLAERINARCVALQPLLGDRDPRLQVALERKLDSVTRGDPTGPHRMCSGAAGGGADYRGPRGQRARREPPATGAGGQPAGEP